MKSTVDNYLKIIESEIEKGFSKYKGHAFSFNFDIQISDLGACFQYCLFENKVRSLEVFKMISYDTRLYIDVFMGKIKISGSLSPRFNPDYTNAIINSLEKARQNSKNL